MMNVIRHQPGRRARRSGFTLVEVLIALAIIGIAIAALSLTQVTNLRASVVARSSSDVKAVANVELERLMADVLEISGGTFFFNEYYWKCPPLAGGETPSAPLLPGLTPLPCSAGIPEEEEEEPVNPALVRGDVEVLYLIRGEPGVLGEGIISITVTAQHTRTGQRLTIGDRITCYDVFPSPKATAPEPCPTPTDTGSGRSS